jgi:hypothetical protein
LISFSTQPSNVVLDGTGRNSPYTGPLVKRIGRRAKLALPYPPVVGIRQLNRSLMSFEF